MSETGEIGPFDKSSEASVKRFEARQEHKESTEGQVISAARFAEIDNKEEQEVSQKEEQELPDVLEHKTFWGIPTTKIQKWFKNPTSKKSS